MFRFVYFKFLLRFLIFFPQKVSVCLGYQISVNMQHFSPIRRPQKFKLQPKFKNTLHRRLLQAGLITTTLCLLCIVVSTIQMLFCEPVLFDVMKDTSFGFMVFYILLICCFLKMQKYLK